ncbi:MAG: GNAT family N-acetyltransferase [Oscillospiraceae bacterium]|nr:GNAT family N-acetyltransferase [Oscillospiraceae bacterium]
MLRIANSLKELDFAKLMAVYEESNRENGRDNYPEEPEERQLFLQEENFYQYLRQVFFVTPGAVCAVWEEDGQYRAALRLEPYKDGLLLEALETTPAYRRKGYARQMIKAVQAHFADKRIYSHVHKKNLPSLAIHEACGFQRVSEQAAYIDGSVNSRCCTLCWEVESLRFS